MPQCEAVHSVNKSEQCDFVTKQEDCQIQGGYLDYTRFVYCYLHDYKVAGIFIFVFWLTFLFINMGMAVRDFLCPSLDAIARTLRLSENVAGVTFLALGNGAADIFSIVVLMIKEDRNLSYAETAIGSIFGGGLFVVSVVAGVICLNYKIKVEPVLFFRDMGTYLVAISWLVGMLADGKIVTGEAIGFVTLYALYVVLVLISNQWEKRKKQQAGMYAWNASMDLVCVCVCV